MFVVQEHHVNGCAKMPKELIKKFNDKIVRIKYFAIFALLSRGKFNFIGQF